MTTTLANLTKSSPGWVGGESPGHVRGGRRWRKATKKDSVDYYLHSGLIRRFFAFTLDDFERWSVKIADVDNSNFFDTCAERIMWQTGYANKYWECTGHNVDAPAIASYGTPGNMKPYYVDVMEIQTEAGENPGDMYSPAQAYFVCAYLKNQKLADGSTVKWEGLAPFRGQAGLARLPLYDEQLSPGSGSRWFIGIKPNKKATEWRWEDVYGLAYARGYGYIATGDTYGVGVKKNATVFDGADTSDPRHWYPPMAEFEKDIMPDPSREYKELFEPYSVEDWVYDGEGRWYMPNVLGRTVDTYVFPETGATLQAIARYAYIAYEGHQTKIIVHCKKPSYVSVLADDELIDAKILPTGFHDFVVREASETITKRYDTDFTPQIFNISSFLDDVRGERFIHGDHWNVKKTHVTETITFAKFIKIRLDKVYD